MFAIISFVMLLASDWALGGHVEGGYLHCRSHADTVLDFKEHLPEHCPPAEAKPAGGTFFRLIRGDEVSADEFRSQAELGKVCPDECDPCQWAGLSLCAEREDLEAPRKAAPKRFKTAKVARGTLSKSDGLTQATPRAKNLSHTTYWPYKSVQPWLLFQIVNDQSNDG